mmetsp:Transcript_64195/g.165780  ORF Transcript_64195/g.165780 Transcript_64195/m.165780 type:complete len:214 (+) Transcript_64195:46-687(+)
MRNCFCEAGSEPQLVRVHLGREREARLEVRPHIGGEALGHRLVQGLLAGLLLSGHLFLLGAGRKHGLALLAGRLLLPREVRVVDGAEAGALEVHLGAGPDAHALVHPPEGHAVHGVGAGDEQEAAGELLEEDRATATEAARQHNEHGARDEALLEFLLPRRLLLGALDLGSGFRLAVGPEDLPGLSRLAHLDGVFLLGGAARCGVRGERALEP